MNLSHDNFTLTQALPTINRQIELLQVDNRRPHALVSLDIGFLLLTARLKLSDDFHWPVFLGNLGMSPEIAQAYMNLSNALLELDAACRLYVPDEPLTQHPDYPLTDALQADGA